MSRVAFTFRGSTRVEQAHFCEDQTSFFAFSKNPIKFGVDFSVGFSFYLVSYLLWRVKSQNILGSWELCLEPPAYLLRAIHHTQELHRWYSSSLLGRQGRSCRRAVIKFFEEENQINVYVVIKFMNSNQLVIRMVVLQQRREF